MDVQKCSQPKTVQKVYTEWKRVYTLQTPQDVLFILDYADINVKCYQLYTGDVCDMVNGIVVPAEFAPFGAATKAEMGGQTAAHQWSQATLSGFQQ